MLVVLALSAVFDMAYGRAMQQTDVRQLVRQDLQERVGKAPATIGVSPFGPYFYTVMPAAKPLISDKVMVLLQSPAQDADFFLIGLPTDVEPAETNAIVGQVEVAGKFSYDKSYNVPVMIFGREFRLLRFPRDMTYPFPTILLFRARAQG